MPGSKQRIDCVLPARLLPYGCGPGSSPHDDSHDNNRSLYMEVWKIGAATITRVVDLVSRIPATALVPDATLENLAPLMHWLKPHFLNDDGTFALSIHTFLIESCGARILVDTCIGNHKPRGLPDWNMREGRYLEELASLGAPRESIDRVLCTHLHVDHVGWNTMKSGTQWLPTFPNARYLIGEAEWGYWQNEEDPFGKEARADSILPIFAAGLVDLVDASHRINDEVCLIPTPGHTPGHVSVMVTSQGARAVITGDMLHHPLQVARPQWRDIADVDPDQARATRHEFLNRFSDGATLVLGTHFATPTAGRIVRDGDSYRFEV